jgi:hypothetical protein
LYGPPPFSKISADDCSEVQSIASDNVAATDAAAVQMLKESSNRSAGFGLLHRQ